MLCVLVSVCVDQCHQEMGPFPCGNVLWIFHDHNIQRLVESIIRTRWYFSFGFFLYQDSKASSPVTDPLVRMSFKPIYNKIGLGLAGGTVLWFSIISIIILTIIIIFKAITRYGSVLVGNKSQYHSCLFSIFSCVRTKCTKCVECVLSVIANRKNWVWGILACWTSFLSQAYLTNQFLHNLL